MTESESEPVLFEQSAERRRRVEDAAMVFAAQLIRRGTYLNGRKFDALESLMEHAFDLADAYVVEAERRER